MVATETTAAPNETRPSVRMPNLAYRAEIAIETDQHPPPTTAAPQSPG